METDFSTEPIPAKAAEAEKARVHTMITIGGRDMKAGAVSVRLHDDGQQGAKPKAEVLARYKDWPLSTAADADKLRRWTMEEREAWSAVMAIDPLLPAVLLPAVYEGKAAIPFLRTRMASVAHQPGGV